MDKDFQELVVTLIVLTTQIIGAIAVMCLFYEEWKMERRLKKARRMCADNLKKLKFLEGELDRKKHEKRIFIFPFSES